jgi:hypothetical protein
MIPVNSWHFVIPENVLPSGELAFVGTPPQRSS